MFRYPEIFYAILIALPFVIGLVFWSRGVRKRDFLAIGEPQLLARLLEHLPPWRSNLKFWLLTAGLSAMALALMGPQWGSKMVEVHRRGVDVVIALDVSRSMLAEDIKPNRLERAKQELSALIDQLQGDRVGVVAFAGSASTACPLTTDYQAAKMFLSYVTPESVARLGTNLSSAVQQATTMFTEGSEGYRVLVLLTDGEDHGGEALNAARPAKTAGIKILAIGFGNPQGEPIPRYGDGGRVAGYYSDAQGRTVVSRLDEKTLQSMTQATEGVYLPAHQGQIEAERLAEVINAMEKRDISSGLYGSLENRYQIPLAVGIFLLFIGWWLPRQRGVWWVLLLGLGCGLWGLPAQAGMVEDINRGNAFYQKGKFDEALERYRDAQIAAPYEGIVDYNMGNAYSQKEKYEEAEKAYQRAGRSKRKPLQVRTWYNFGNTLVQQKKFKEAIAAYKQGLKVDPQDQDTLYNLAQTIALMKDPQLQKKQDKQKQDEKKQAAQQQQQQSGGAKPNPTPGASLTPQGSGRSAQAQPTPTAGAQEPKPGEMRKEEAENLLEAVRDAERRAQEERMKKNPQQGLPKGQPDW